MWNKRAGGMTLIELIVAMVIVGIAAGAVMVAFTAAVRTSSDPMIQKQMMAVAEGMMEEIRRMPFAVPTASAPAVCGRSTLGNVGAYDGYTSTGVCSVDGTVVLPGFNVRVAVAQSTELSPVPAADQLKITVTVTRGAETIRLVGWRTNFGKQAP